MTSPALSVGARDIICEHFLPGHQLLSMVVSERKYRSLKSREIEKQLLSVGYQDVQPEGSPDEMKMYLFFQ